MAKIISLILLVLLNFPSYSLLNRSGLNNLEIKLAAYLKPYQNKVGVSFIDMDSGLKLSVNGNKKFIAASVAKIYVMAAAYHMAGSGKLNLDEKLLFRESDKLPGSGVLRWMKGGREYTLRNLIRIMIVLSDNSATKMVIDRIGSMEVGNYLSSIEIADTSIVDDTMLNEPPCAKLNLTTPDDASRLLAIIKQSGKFSGASKAEMINYMKRQRYKWGIPRGIKYSCVVANKTGNVEGVLNDAGIVYTKHGNYVLSIFTNGIKKKRDARLIINKVSDIVHAAYVRSF